MKQVCLLCERTSQDNNLWCQETYCPAELSPTILDYGEFLGDIEIIKPVIVMRSAVLYEASHQNEKVFLKVAHPGEKNKERVKREAEFLLSVHKSNIAEFPKLLPAHPNTDLKDFYYGKAMLRSQMLYFYMYEYVPNMEPLSDVLQKNPQPWYKHIGWIMMSISAAISHMHSQNLYHFALTPEAVLVRHDKQNVPRVMLHDFGVAADGQAVGQYWDSMFVPPAYTSPEFLSGQAVRPNPTIDVYGLGLMMYEMLVGESPVTWKLLSDREVYRAVQQARMNRMDRADLRDIPELAIRSVSQQPSQRPGTADDFYNQIAGIIGDIPKEEQSRWPSTDTMVVVIGATLAIAFLIALAVSIYQWGTDGTETAELLQQSAAALDLIFQSFT